MPIRPIREYDFASSRASGRQRSDSLIRGERNRPKRLLYEIIFTPRTEQRLEGRYRSWSVIRRKNVFPDESHRAVINKTLHNRVRPALRARFPLRVRRPVNASRNRIAVVLINSDCSNLSLVRRSIGRSWLGRGDPLACCKHRRNERAALTRVCLYRRRSVKHVLIFRSSLGRARNIHINYNTLRATLTRGIIPRQNDGWRKACLYFQTKTPAACDADQMRVGNFGSPDHNIRTGSVYEPSDKHNNSNNKNLPALAQTFCPDETTDNSRKSGIRLKRREFQSTRSRTTLKT